MRLTPTERDRLLIFTAAELARARRARGLRLNVPEAIALIADTVCEAARDGRRLAEAIEAGRTVLAADDVLPGVADVVTEVEVEAVFDDGTRLGVVSDPFRGGRLARRRRPRRGAARQSASGHDPTEETVVLTVDNTAAVPVSRHLPLPLLRGQPAAALRPAAAYGRRLAVPAGSSVRFDPGAAVEVGLVPIGGDRVAIGFAGLVDGPLDAPGAREAALARARAFGYLDQLRRRREAGQ